MHATLVFNQIKESFLFAFSSLRVNKLRTLLSLLGITIGIFAIISVLTTVSSLERNLKNGINALGDDIIYVQKWPWIMGDNYPWWKFMRRPLPSIKEYQYLKKQLKSAHDLAFSVSKQFTIKYKNEALDGVATMAITDGYQNLRTFEISQGRYFSPYEFKAGKNIVVIGAEVARKLFDTIDPIGQFIKIKGKKFRIIGVFQKEGSSVIDTSLDNTILTNINAARSIINLRAQGSNPFIMLKPKPTLSMEQTMSETRLLLRNYRRLSPREEDDFALNRISMLSAGLENLFSTLDLVAWFIGGFSVLVGGFGIANIMFVSVREQTKLIGIQKALGAKNYFVLLQFLYESVLLSLLGGLLGLVLVFAATQLATHALDFDFSLDTANVLTGILISVVIGMVSGFIPALQAARLNPVVAIARN